jgi:hypothetical protein
VFLEFTGLKFGVYSTNGVTYGFDSSGRFEQAWMVLRVILGMISAWLMIAFRVCWSVGKTYYIESSKKSG